MDQPGVPNLIRQIILLMVTFGIYFAVGYQLEKFVRNPLYRIIAYRLAGAMLLTLPIIIFTTPKSFVVESSDVYLTILFSLVFSLAAVLVSAFRHRSAFDQMMYPHIRVQSWSPLVVVLNILTWMIYLLPYEFVFRGSLLTNSISIMDLWTAFLLNAFVYSLAHAPQGRREALSAFPFGILLCFVSYITGNFWSAYIIHVFLAISNDLFAIRSNPSMHFTIPSLSTQWHSIKKTLL
jgi:membrane protease YdiL (CAAX protease family)